MKQAFFFPGPLSLIVIALLVALPARAAKPEPEPDDEPMFAPALELRDAPPHELFDRPSTAPPLLLAITAGATLRPDGERSYDAMVLLSIPLERLARPRPLRSSGAAPGLSPAVAEEAAPKLKPPPRRPKPASSETSPPEAQDREPPPPLSNDLAEAQPIPLPVVITTEVARSAVRAALRHAGLDDATARIDALASRARTSALLPELRLRVSRLVDEDQNLSPTEYDPGRVTASGGVSLWLEARATWKLDRLVFADEETSFERMRQDRAEARAKAVDRVIELLVAWQRALALECYPGTLPEERFAATLAVIETEARLEVLTGGWFTRWRSRTRSR